MHLLIGTALIGAALVFGGIVYVVSNRPVRSRWVCDAMIGNVWAVCFVALFAFGGAFAIDGLIRWRTHAPSPLELLATLIVAAVWFGAWKAVAPGRRAAAYRALRPRAAEGPGEGPDDSDHPTWPHAA